MCCTQCRMETVFFSYFTPKTHTRMGFTQISLDLGSAIFVKSAVFGGGNQSNESNMGKNSNLSHTDDASDSFDHRKTCLGGNIVQIEDKVGVFTFALILHMCDVDPLRRDDGEDLG